jgi:hypothetical protein
VLESTSLSPQYLAVTRRQIKRIAKANITFLSLVPSGANRLGVLYKDGNSPMVEFEGLCKADSEGKVIAAVYVPGMIDNQGMFAGGDQVEQMAHTFMKNGAKLDVLHDQVELNRSAAFVAESFIIQKGDQRFADLKDKTGKLIDATGGWGTVIKLEDPVLKSLYESKEWRGVSLFGPAILEYVDMSKSEEIPMTPEEFAALSKPHFDALKTDILAAVTKAIAPPADAATPPASAADLMVKIDPNDPASLAAAQAKLTQLRFVELAKGVDFTDEKAVKALMGKLTGKTPVEQPVETMLGEMKTMLVKCEGFLKKQSKASAQSTGALGAGEGDETTVLEKTDEEAFKVGKDVANFLNHRRYGTPLMASANS